LGNLDILDPTYECRFRRPGCRGADLLVPDWNRGVPVCELVYVWYRGRFLAPRYLVPDWRGRGGVEARTDDVCVERVDVRSWRIHLCG
jgi:hypothetical protein